MPGSLQSPPSSTRYAILAAALYLGLVLWTLRVVLPAPASTFPHPVRIDTLARVWTPLVQSDQQFTAARMSYNARTILTHPSRLMDGNQCRPLPNAATMGHHMIGAGLRATIPYLATRDPVLTYNIVVGMTFWIAALAMYALAFSWTRSSIAAFVAGLLFAFHPGRIVGIANLHLLGDQWAPLALLFAHRLFTKRRWIDAVMLAIFIGLDVLEGAYPMLALGIVGGTYGIYLLGRHLRELRMLAPKILLPAAVVSILLAGTLLPYAETRAVWDQFGGRGVIPRDLRSLGWGESGYFGTSLLVLTLVGLFDRLQRVRLSGGYDPRLIYLLGGLLALWASGPAYAIPGIGLQVPSLLTLVSSFVPGLDLLRVSGTCDSGARLVASFLAAYGVLALTERRGATIRGAIVALIIVVACLEVFHPPFARRSFGTSVEFRPYLVRPPVSLLDLYGKMGKGAVVDLPHDYRFGGFLTMAQHALLAAFHGRPIASCYNSFRTPVQAEVAALAARGPSDSNAGDALYALGFRNLVVHALVPGQRRAMPIIARPLPRHLVEVGRTFQHGVYRLESERPIVAEFAALLAKADPFGAAVVVAPPVAEVSLRFQNRTDATYRHPDPIVPTRLVASWYRSSGALVERHELKTLLPLALAPGEETTRAVKMRVPLEPGEYRLSLTPAAKPELVVSRAVVLVDASKAEKFDGRAASGRR